MNDDSGPVGVLDSAARYARFGLTIFPVLIDDGAPGNKGPMPGYGWVALATSKMNEVMEDFDRAIQIWGEDRVGIGWACGLDQFVAVDLDLPHTQWPTWATEISGAAALNITKRGTHLIFKFPAGLEPGNTDTKFPTSGWGEVRGKHGYIIIAGPDRVGLDVHEFDHCQAFPYPEWLEAYGGGAEAVSVAEVMEFAAAHNGVGSMPNKINGIEAACERWDPAFEGDPSKGRHPYAVWLMTTVAEEALAGFYPFAEGLLIVKTWWKRVTPPHRHKREWNGIVTWAVGRALQQHPPTVEAVETEPHTPADDGITLVDWHEFFTKERLDPEWLVQDLWPFGRHISIGSKAGQGKSELIQYVVSCLALGIDPWTRQEREPRRVIYLDMEMPEEDLFDRMINFGYGVGDAPLLQANLLYAILPVIPALNSRAGLSFVEGLVDRYTPDVFIIDTFMKTLQGDENDAATVQEFTRLTGMLLKSRRIASGRADHYGKNIEQGNRGTSAKDDDVDVAWKLERAGRFGTKLTATKRRQGFVPEKLFFERWHSADEGVRFLPRDQVIENVPSAGALDLVAAMDLHAIPLTWGRDRVRQRLAEHGLSASTNELTEALKLRKARGPLLTVVSDRSSDRYTDTEDVDK